MRLVLLGVAVYLVTLVITFPAAVAYTWLQPLISPAPVVLSALKGTVWEGQAAVTFKGRPLGRAEWSLSPWSLLLGRLQADYGLRSEGGFLNGSATLKLSGDTLLQGLDGRIPIMEIAPHLTPFPVVLEGAVSFHLEEARLSDGKFAGAVGKLLWQQAGVTIPQALKLGDLELTLEPSAQGEGTVGRLRDLGGPLQAEGELRLESDSYRLAATVSARESQSPLAQMLPLLGRADAKGRVRLNYSGRF